MFRSVIIVLLLIYLAGVFEIKQWTKIPELFHHFTEHHADHESLSFIDFLNLHYAHDRHHHSDSKEHQKLPFGDTQTYAIYLFAVDVPQPVGTPLEVPAFSAEPLKSNRIASGLPDPIGSSVWQPPRTNA